MTTTVSSPTDAELVARARAKGAEAQAAFRALHDRYKDEVLATLTCLVRDRALAEDAHQEAFVRAFGALDRFDPARSFRAWLHQIAKNAAIDLLRVEEKEKRLAEEKERRAARDPALVPATVEQRETEERTRVALDSLPVELRALLVQRHGLGLTLGELARSLGVSERTVTTRLQEASALLASALARGGR